MANILLVEDDDTLTNVMSQLLADAGHAVTTACNGKPVTALMSQADLIITDLFMPEMDGLEVIAAVRERSPDLPVIAISGGASTRPVDLLNTAKTLGATEILAKPFQSTVLLNMVDTLLTGHLDEH